MIERECALQIQKNALDAIEKLSLILNLAKDHCTTDDYEKIKRGVGISIGEIQTELLEIINMQYPELDDLAEK